MKISRILVILGVILILFTGIAAAATIEIQVTDNNSNPIQNATITITDKDTGKIYQSITDANGFATKTGLESSAIYSITIIKDGYEDATLELSPGTGTEVKRVILKSLLEPVTFYIRDSNNNALEGITVKLSRNGNESTQKTNSMGYVDFDILKNTDYTITIGSEKYATISEPIKLASSENSRTFVLSRANVSPIVIVYNDNKNPIKNAAVTINDTDVYSTDENGKCQLKAINTGNYTLKVEATGYITYTEDYNFTSDKTEIPITLTGKDTSIILTVKDNNGTALSNTSIYKNDVISGKTDSTGAITINANVGSTVKITATHEGYVKGEKIYTVEPTENVIGLSLEPGSSTVNITVSDTDGKALPDATISVDSSVVGTTDASGTYILTTITGKIHVISASLDGYSGEGKTISVNAGENWETITLTKDFNYAVLIICIVAGVLVILITVLILTNRDKINFGKKNKGNGKFPVNRDSL